MTEGLPLWAVFITLVLSGGVGAGMLKIAETWIAGRSSKSLTSSTVKLNDVSSLNQAINGLSGENGRMAKRISDLETRIGQLQQAVDDKDKRIDDLEVELAEQRNRRHELERHLGLAEKRIDSLATEMKKRGLDPGPIIGVPI